MEQATFLSSNGRDTITYSLFPTENTPTYVVQLVHGMCEHIERYTAFAQFLNEHNIAVIGHDHMAHGKSIYDERGLFKDAKQSNYIVEDTHIASKIAKECYPDAKIILFCHSMGSFIGRILTARYPDLLDGIIISGTSGKNPLASVGKGIALLLKSVRGENHRSKLIDTLSFGSYNKKYKDVQTNFDWLSTDRTEVQKYIEDDNCGFLFSVNGSAMLTDLVMQANHEKTFKATRNNLPILLISGKDDPVGNYGKGVLEVAARYKSAGCTIVGSKLYSGARHELLNDFVRHETYLDTLHFIEAI